MREILFRGKIVDNGGWIYGSLITDVYENYPRILSGSYISKKSKLKFASFPVNNETISEFSGLRDKNGTRIFEGDIVRFCEYEDLFVVSFEDFFWIISNRNIFQYYQRKLDLDSSTYEVVGNIYDNPELIS